MATAQVQIDRALRLIDQLNSGESGTAQESADGLIALNAMVGSWLANRDIGIVTLTTYATLATDQTLPLGYDDAIAQNLAIRLAPEYKFQISDSAVAIAGDTLKLIRRGAAPTPTGTAQNIVNRALRMVGQIGPDEISTATESNYALVALNAMIGTWTANRDLGLITLTTYATLGTSQSLPAGYDDALAYNLSVRIGPEYKSPPNDVLVSLAADTLKFIRRAAAPAITATVQKLVIRTLRLIGQIGPDETATTTELNYVFDALNDMLGVWRNEQLMCYAMQDESIPLSSGNTSRTVGPTGDLVSTRPVSIKEAYVTYSNVDTAIKVLEYDQYAYIPNKASTSTFPTRIYYKPEMPDGRIYLWPVPNVSSVLHILTEVPVLSFAALSTTLTLPPGWNDAIPPNLAVRIAPEFNRDVRPTVLAMAANTKRLIKRTNTRPIKSTNELVAISRRNHSNIISGT